MVNGMMSLWSHPMKRGFTLEHMLLWGLSVATARRHFGRLHIVTDEAGAKLLKDFPYDSIRTDLQRDFVPDFSRHLWAAGKLLAFKIMAEQSGEWCHFDGDVLLRKPLRVFGSGLYAQSDEAFCNPEYRGFKSENSHFHKTYLEGNAKNLPVLPGYMRFSLTRDYQTAYNAGILGGRDRDFIGEYASESLYILRHQTNQRVLKTLTGGTGSCFVEQYMFGAKADFESKHVATLFPHCSEGNEDFMESIGYVHLLGPSKNDPFVIESVRQILEESFPYMYELVMSLGLPSNPFPQSCQTNTNPPSRSVAGWVGRLRPVS